MNSVMSSALAMALALGLVTTAEAEEWTGAHLTFGISAGSLDLRDTQENASPSLSPEEDDVSPYVAAGYDWAFDGFTLGVVGDVDFTSVENGDLLSAGKGTYAETDWFATLRGRVGMPVNDQVHVYVSGGLAMMRAGATQVGIFGLQTEADAQTLTGPAAGLTLEYALSPGRHLSVEYLYADFSESDPFIPGSSDDATIDPIVSTVRLGYTLRF